MAEQGNAAVMHKALEDALELLESDDRQLIEYSDTGALMDIIRPALAEPPRNCDVGTAQEQYERWKEFCNNNWSSANAAAGLDPCDDCQFVDCDVNGNSSGCQFAWGQAPYKGKEESNG